MKKNLERLNQEDVITREVALETPSPNETPTIKSSEQVELTPVVDLESNKKDVDEKWKKMVKPRQLPNERKEKILEDLADQKIAELREEVLTGGKVEKSEVPFEQWQKQAEEEKFRQAEIAELKEKAKANDLAKKEEQVLPQPTRQKTNWLNRAGKGLAGLLGLTIGASLAWPETTDVNKPNTQSRTTIESKEQVTGHQDENQDKT